MSLTSDEDDAPISNNAKRGTNSGALPFRVLERMADSGKFNDSPAVMPIHIAMNDGGRGTPGRKVYPNLPSDE